MSYQPGTILTRRNPKDDHLDVVRVVCPSPVSATSVSDWSGIAGAALIVEPYETFGASEVMPTAIANEQYEITGYPEDEAPARIVHENPRAAQLAQMAPEEKFAADAREAAKGNPAKSTSTRGKTPIGGKA